MKRVRCRRCNHAERAVMINSEVDKLWWRGVKREEKRAE